ncbi:hypothetical protein A2W32_03560 [candidate division WWE3 bacterium RBG_16_37_10]|uniref:Uncharacterized protein n=1 Tax=candidate division WWE3 bacterium RBG_16_37_10 TaxID=1802610 RepID=A0A1F4UTN8_UNCKA|nr:MAG: hypothetical protein A2W32_03560 [candidate division WWE3 bacterium RBG_16_37_10]
MRSLKMLKIKIPNIKNATEKAEILEAEEYQPNNKYQKAKDKKEKNENKLKATKKSLKRTLKPFLKKENITKFIIIFSSIALLATSILPFIIQ